MVEDVTNPGLVNVADQGDGLLSVDQAVLTGPSSSAGSAIPAVSGPGGGGTQDTTNPDLVDVADQSFDGLPQEVNVP